MAWRDPWETVDRANALRAQKDAQGINMLQAMGQMQTNALQRQQMQNAMETEAATRQVFQQFGNDPTRLRAELVARGLRGPVKELDAEEMQRKRGALYDAQAGELKRKADEETRRRGATENLGNMLKVGPADESGYQQIPFVGSESELVAHMKANPGRYRLINPAEVRSTALEANPNEAAKSILSLTTPKGIKDMITPVAGGFAQMGANSRPEFVRTQDQRPVNQQIIQTTQGPRVLEPGGSSSKPITDESGKPLPSPTAPNLKPLPPTVLKMQGEEIDMIQTAGGINADLKALVGQIDDKKLDLGVMSNLVNKARNKVGLSNEESRALGSFSTTLQKLRNDSLRLNKGTQTEGDAVRAWQELVDGINDGKLVRQRLEEIQALNDRAIKLRVNNVDLMRANYGHEPIDLSSYIKQPAAVGTDRGKANAPTKITGDADYNALPSGATFIGPDGKTRRKP